MIELLIIVMLCVLVTCLYINNTQEDGSANEHHEKEYNDAKKERENND